MANFRSDDDLCFCLCFWHVPTARYSCISGDEPKEIHGFIKMAKHIAFHKHTFATHPDWLFGRIPNTCVRICDVDVLTSLRNRNPKFDCAHVNFNAHVMVRPRKCPQILTTLISKTFETERRISLQKKSHHPEFHYAVDRKKASCRQCVPISKTAKTTESSVRNPRETHTNESYPRSYKGKTPSHAT